MNLEANSSPEFQKEISPADTLRLAQCNPCWTSEAVKYIESCWFKPLTCGISYSSNTKLIRQWNRYWKGIGRRRVRWWLSSLDTILENKRNIYRGGKEWWKNIWGRDRKQKNWFAHTKLEMSIIPPTGSDMRRGGNINLEQRGPVRAGGVNWLHEWAINISRRPYMCV